MADSIRSIGALAPGVTPLQVTFSPQVRTESPPAPKADASPGPASRTDSDPSAPAASRTAGTGPALQKAAQKVQEFLDLTKSELSFKIDHGSGQSFFRVVDPKSGKVILQVPSEDVLKSARRLREAADQANASGVFLDKEG